MSVVAGQLIKGQLLRVARKEGTIFNALMEAAYEQNIPVIYEGPSSLSNDLIKARISRVPEGTEKFHREHGMHIEVAWVYGIKSLELYDGNTDESFLRSLYE